MADPKITVLMTVFNGGKYFPLSLESVLKQTFRDFELLIINDCSTDGSADIVGSYHDERITLFTNERNLGQTASLNIGLRKAKGRYIARMDADDYAFPHWLENQLSFIEGHPGHAVVGCKAAVIDEVNCLIKVLNTPDCWEDIVLKSLTVSPVNHVGSISEKKEILGAGGYDESFRIAADYDLWSRFIAMGKKIMTRDEIGVAIRVHAKSISIHERGRKDVEEISRIISKNIASLTTSNVFEADIQLLWRFIYDPAGLTSEQFNRAKEILKDVGMNLKPQFNITKPYRKKKLSNQITTSTLKRIFFLIRRSDINGVRQLARDYIKENGSANVLGAFLVLSYFGRMILRFLPDIHEKTSKFLAQLALWNKPCPQLISSGSETE